MTRAIVAVLCALVLNYAILKWLRHRDKKLASPERLVLPDDDEYADFNRKFPGKCSVCAYWRFGRRECYTTSPTPAHEKCPEGNSAGGSLEQ